MKRLCIYVWPWTGVNGWGQPISFLSLAFHCFGLWFLSFCSLPYCLYLQLFLLSSNRTVLLAWRQRSPCIMGRGFVSCWAKILVNVVLYYFSASLPMPTKLLWFPKSKSLLQEKKHANKNMPSVVYLRWIPYCYHPHHMDVELGSGVIYVCNPT